MGSNESKHLFLALALNMWMVRPTKEFCGHLPSILCYPLLQRALWLGDARELARAGEAILVSAGIETKLGMESSGLGWKSSLIWAGNSWILSHPRFSDLLLDAESLASSVHVHVFWMLVFRSEEGKGHDWSICCVHHTETACNVWNCPMWDFIPWTQVAGAKFLGLIPASFTEKFLWGIWENGANVLSLVSSNSVH